jgi:ABC-type molybdate transport system substrate-binding protein
MGTGSTGIVQRITIFSAGVSAASTNPAVAKTYIEFLTSPQAIRIIRRTSLEPVAVDRRCASGTIGRAPRSG